MKSKFLLLCIFIPVLVEAGVWSSFHHDTLRTGLSPYEGSDRCDILCQVNVKASRSSPVIDGSGHLYIPGIDSTTGKWALWCINTLDCSVNWKCQLGSGSPAAGIHSSCAISPDDSTVYVGYKTALFAVDTNGTLKWSYTTGGNIGCSPAVASNGTIYVGCEDSYLYAINSDSTLKWKYQTGGSLISSPAIGSDGTVYIGCSTDQKLYAINPNGTFKWSYATNGNIFSSPAVGSNSAIYVGSRGWLSLCYKPEW